MRSGPVSAHGNGSRRCSGPGTASCAPCATGCSATTARRRASSRETFLKLDGHPVLDRPDEEVAAWLRRVCLNASYNRLRGQRRATARLDRAGRLERVDDEVDEGGGPLLDVLRAEEQRAVRRALAALPERQRACLLLRHAGFSYAEVAATLDLAVGSVGVLLARGERAFRDAYLANDDADPGAYDALP